MSVCENNGALYETFVAQVTRQQRIGRGSVCVWLFYCYFIISTTSGTPEYTDGRGRALSGRRGGGGGPEVEANGDELAGLFNPAG